MEKFVNTLSANPKAMENGEVSIMDVLRQEFQ
jgi:hypothetical protein